VLTRFRPTSTFAAVVVALATLGGVTVSVAVSTAPAGALRSANTSVVPATIAHDCSTDVTAALKAWIAKAPAGSTLALAAKGCYRIDETLTITNRSGLTIEGNGSVLRAVAPGNQQRRHVWIQGGKNIVLRDLAVEGTNTKAGASKAAYVPSSAFQHAFALTGVTNARLDHVRGTNVSGDFVYIGAGSNGRWSRGIRVDHSSFQGSGRQGISITAGRDVTIDHNSIAGVPRSMFDFEANTASGGAEHVTVSHNATGAALNFWLANKGVGTNTGRIVFTRNTMTQPTGGLVFVYGPGVGYRGPFTFTDNRLLLSDTVHDEGSKGAFFLSRAKNVTITGNSGTFPVGRNVPVVENQGSVKVTAKGNRFANAGPDSISTTRPAPKVTTTTAPGPTPTTVKRVGT